MGPASLPVKQGNPACGLVLDCFVNGYVQNESHDVIGQRQQAVI
jgi:hypothetical protein